MSPPSQHAAKAPLFLNYRSSTWFIMLTVAMAVFTDIFLYAVIVPVLPFSLESRAQVPPEDVQRWTSVLLGCYGVAVIFGAPAIGYFSSSFPNRRVPLFLGLVALLLATGLLCIGSSITILALGRLFQGLSAAVVGTMGLALVADTFEQKKMGQAMGYVSLASSVAAFVSPLLGGVVYSQGGYYAVFGMCFGLIVLDLLLRLCVVEKKDAARWIDRVDQRRLSSGSRYEERIPLTNPDSSHPTLSKNDARAHPLKWRNSVIPLLLTPRLPVTLAVILVRSLLLTSFDATLPLFVNNTFSWNSLGSGLIFLPFILPLFLAPYIGFLADKRFQPRLITSAGFFCAVPVLASLRFIERPSKLPGWSDVALLAVMLTGVGLALVLMLPPTMVEVERIIAESSSRRDGVEITDTGALRGQVYGLVNCAWASGTLAGPLWGGLVVVKAGWKNMTLSLALLSTLLGLLAVRFTPFLSCSCEEPRWDQSLAIHEWGREIVTDDFDMMT